MWRWLTQPQRAARSIIALSLTALACGILSLAALIASLTLNALASPDPGRPSAADLMTLGIEILLFLGLVATLYLVIRMLRQPPPGE